MIKLGKYYLDSNSRNWILYEPRAEAVEDGSELTIRGNSRVRYYSSLKSLCEAFIDLEAKNADEVELIVYQIRAAEQRLAELIEKLGCNEPL